MYHSTRDASLRATDAEALLQGLAPDGGLFVPEKIPTVDFRAWRGLRFEEVAQRIFRLYFPSLGEERIANVVKTAYDKRFRTRQICPVHPVDQTLALLELWHGPSLAFKDIALSALPHLMRAAQEVTGDTDRLLILTATSGDTGKAAMEGFAGVDGFGVLVFYPADGVSRAQEKQMCTQKENNVFAYAVEGNFDDCQRAVKAFFTDKAMASSLKKQGVRLSSANSINIGRLVPQIVYYFTAYESLVLAGAISEGAPLDVTVPTGNFGDVLAGYYAKRMGLPLRILTVASNTNHVLTDFGQSGTYDARRELVRTTSPSMDILVSSNLERFLYHESKDAEIVRVEMQKLASEGHFSFALSDKDMRWGYADEDAVQKTIATLYRTAHQVVDPHTAVALHVQKMLSDAQSDKDEARAYQLVLSTASPFKFADTVLRALHRPVPASLAQQWEELAALSKVPVPEPLRVLAREKGHAPQRLTREAMRDAVIGFAKGV